jgi:hypothetical protein
MLKPSHGQMDSKQETLYGLLHFNRKTKARNNVGQTASHPSSKT